LQEANPKARDTAPEHFARYRVQLFILLAGDAVSRTANSKKRMQAGRWLKHVIIRGHYARVKRRVKKLD
jgi:hypothetical protein